MPPGKLLEKRLTNIFRREAGNSKLMQNRVPFFVDYLIRGKGTALKQEHLEKRDKDIITALASGKPELEGIEALTSLEQVLKKIRLEPLFKQFRGSEGWEGPLRE